MPSSTNSRTGPEVRKASVTAPAPAKRGTTGAQTPVSKRAVRAARRAAERRRRNAWFAGILIVLVVAGITALIVTHVQPTPTASAGPKYNCATPTATAIGPQPAVTPAPTPPALASSATLQTKAVTYTDATTGATQSANLQYAIIKEGCGPAVASGDSVVVQYTGWVESTGKLFDSSFLHAPTDCNGTVTGSCGFAIGQQQVISGWDNGIPGMKPGEMRRLIIPAALAYGATGQTDQTTGAVIIPPNAALVFDITLVSITAGS